MILLFKSKAMKTIQVKDDTASDEKEHLILKGLNNENIIRYFDHFDEEIHKKSYLCIVTELCEVLQIDLICKMFTFFQQNFITKNL